MQLPFTAEQFISVFRGYNESIGLLPVIAYAAGALAVLAALRGHRGAGRLVSLILTSLWAFTGVGYHFLHFAAINPAARIFGVMFILQAAAFAFEAFRGHLQYGSGPQRPLRRMGLVMISFAMFVYPLIGMLSGHGYPNGPVFGLTPCPLVIFTFGLLLLSDRTLPKHLVVVPLLWALIGSTAALALGVREDIGLLVSGLVGSVMLLSRRSETSRSCSSAGETPAKSTPVTQGIRPLGLDCRRTR